MAGPAQRAVKANRKKRKIIYIYDDLFVVDMN